MRVLVRRGLRWLGLGRTDPVRALAQRANAARDGGDWTLAAELFGRVAALRPDKPAYLVQRGHALKECGDRTGAMAAYRAAADAAPDDIDAQVHLAALLREAGDDAGAATTYAALLRIDPRHAGARRGAVELGRRDLLDGTEDPLIAAEARLVGIADVVGRAMRVAEAAVATSALSTAAYDLFRRTYPLRPPPLLEAPAGLVHIVVDARRTDAAALRSTLSALADLVDTDWTARVLLADGLRDHPVASFAAVDPRIMVDGDPDVVSDAAYVLLVDGTARPAPLAVVWLRFALARTGAGAAYGDHDWREESWRNGVVHLEPMLFDAFDPERMRVQDPPVMALFTAAAWRGVGDVRERLLQTPRVAHVPRMLASRYAMPASARMAPADAPAAAEPVAVAPTLPDTDPLPIAIIIPTRDESASLERAIGTMREAATWPERLRFVIVDNRSVLDSTRAALAALERTGAVVLPFDEAFNWSRANNLGMAQSDAPLLVFANNDVEMLTRGWDVVLDHALRSPGIGAVGARLLYPDGTIQHAGVLFDTDDRVLSVHDGIGQSGDAGGPGGRWQQRRAVSAVTGAFLAVRRDLMDAVGGFDERLFVAYNDIDLCMRLRALGLSVVYEPAIALTHVESKTRGLNRTAGHIAWDEGELLTLADRWGPALRSEPGYNPQWARGGRPFTGYREPPLSAILAHLDLACLRSAWAVETSSK